MKKLGRAFLVLSAGLVSGLIVVAVASGSQAQVTQKALEAPRPSGSPKKTAGLVEQVACASATNCGALGVSLYSELGGKWQAAKTPVVPGTGSTNLRSIDCPAAGKCEAVALGGLNHVVRMSENGRQWTAGEIALPSDAAPVNPPAGPEPLLNSISCTSPGNCVAVGSYLGERMTHPLVVTESDGTWGTGVEPQLPPNADTSPDPNFPGVGGGLEQVSCSAAGECTAVGWYTNKDAGHSIYPWALTERAGIWLPGLNLILPNDASVQGDSEKGASPFFGFTGLSCPAAENCTAVGGYEDKNGADEGLIFKSKYGTWSLGIRAPLPPKARPITESNEFETPLASVSCSSPGWCSAVGWYVSTSRTRHGLLLIEHRGQWRASTLALPAKARAVGNGVFPISVSCPARGDCLAVGYYSTGRGRAHGLVVRERGGKWGRAFDAELPRNGSGKSQTHLNSVSCPSTSACTAGGYYTDRSGKTQGLLLSLRLR